MNLTIDIGNTYVKVAIFEHYKIIHFISFKLSAFEEQIKSIAEKFKEIKKVMISFVVKFKEQNLVLLRKIYSEVWVLDAETPLPFSTTYKTPHTLGKDRIALAAAAVGKYPNCNVLVIDAGTCVTYEMVTKDKIYLGGAIAPGLQLRYQSLKNHTANLPLLTKTYVENFIGQSTEESIHNGVTLGFLREMEATILQYQEHFEDLKIILTGGDAIFLSKRLKSTIFVDINFLLEGLNIILEHNKG